MKEISVILKNNLLITLEEFRLLDKYSYPGKIWTLIQRPPTGQPHKITERKVEYIFDDETLTMFAIVSTNILAVWETDITKHLRLDEEYQLKDTIFIRQYQKY